jgi:DNA-directed RNA polymerase II subunit RPB1
VNKSGLFNDDVGPIAKACYEVTTEGFVNASRFGEFDPMLGVSSCVMTGQKASFGTNAFQLMLDEDIAIGTKELAIDMKTTELKIQEEFDENRQEDNECSKKVIEINNRIFKNSSIVATDMCQDDYTMVF